MVRNAAKRLFRSRWVTLDQKVSSLKIRVSAVQFCTWPPCTSATCAIGRAPSLLSVRHWYNFLYENVAHRCQFSVPSFSFDAGHDHLTDAHGREAVQRAECGCQSRALWQLANQRGPNRSSAVELPVRRGKTPGCSMRQGLVIHAPPRGTSIATAGTSIRSKPTSSCIPALVW